MKKNNVSATQIQAIVFDAYGTLFDVHSVISKCNELYSQKGKQLSDLWRAKQVEYTFLRSLMDRYEDFRLVTESALIYASKALGLPDEPQKRRELMRAYLTLEPYPEVAEALNVMPGYTLAILSNGEPKMLAAAAESAGLTDYFSAIISVDQTGVYKPDPRVYALAADTLGMEKTTICFVSANGFDVAGAKSFGFYTCRVNRANRPADELGYEPDLTVNNLLELADILN